VCFLILLSLTASLYAQTPEIRGSVLDPSLHIGIAGAQVTLAEFSVVDNVERWTPRGATVTDAQGAFRFAPTTLAATA
jgi:hypothetical protein